MKDTYFQCLAGFDSVERVISRDYATASVLDVFAGRSCGLAGHVALKSGEKDVVVPVAGAYVVCRSLWKNTAQYKIEQSSITAVVVSEAPGVIPSRLWFLVAVLRLRCSNRC